METGQDEDVDALSDPGDAEESEDDEHAKSPPAAGIAKLLLRQAQAGSREEAGWRC
jgi:hypothetical protein